MNDIQLNVFLVKLLDEKSNTGKFIQDHFGYSPGGIAFYGHPTQAAWYAEVAGLLKEAADYINTCYKANEDF